MVYYCLSYLGFTFQLVAVMIRLGFDITPQKTILVTMLMNYSFWFLGYHKELETLFSFLQMKGYPVGVDHGDNDKNHPTITMTWILPIHLAQFLVEKFDGNNQYMLSHLKTYLNTFEYKHIEIKE